MKQRKFQININLGNAAMLTGYDIANALAEIANILNTNYTDAEGAHLKNFSPYTIRDINGNIVGTAKIIN
jgi:hypothetical protein